MFALDITTFRLLLICAVAALIILLIVFRYRRHKQVVRRQHLSEVTLGPLFSEQEEEEKERREGEGTGQERDPQPSMDEEPTESTSEAAKPEPDNRNVIAITLKARRREGFSGRQLLSIFTRFNLEHGDMDIFHRTLHSSGKPETSFSIVNGVEPGTLNPTDLEETSTPAIIFFLRLHSCNQPLKAFAEMIDVAKQFAHLLDGQLFDDQGSHLAPQTITYYKDLIRTFLLNQTKPQTHDSY